jgi:hypothetical protein
MQRFARYKTEAARAYDLSLHCLRTLKKIQLDEQRWQFHIDSQKQKLAIHIERFELSKQRHQQATIVEEDLPPLTDPPAPPPDQNGVGQTLYIGVEKGKTIIYETTPSNADIRHLLNEDSRISRTYNFVGSVPPEYQHLLAGESYEFGKSTRIYKTYNFEDWIGLVERET